MSVVDMQFLELSINEAFADMALILEDGTRILAHKNIVFKHAPYFE